MENQFMTLFMIVFTVINVWTVRATFINSPDCGTGGVAVNTRIVGGVDAQPLDLPFMVSLQHINNSKSGKHFCGGTVLNERWILTAAHCLTRIPFVHPVAPDKVQLIVGAIDSKNYSADNVFLVDKWVTNGCYLFDLWDVLNGDIALIRTATDIVINGQKVTPICIPAPGFQPSSGDAIIAGWGIWEPSGSEPSRLLQKSHTSIVDEEVCQVYTWFRNIGFFRQPSGSKHCAMDTSSTGCRGDSGGPLMQIINGKIYQLGVASYISATLPTLRPMCSKGNPIFYQKVVNEWIADTIAEYNQINKTGRFVSKCNNQTNSRQNIFEGWFPEP